MCLGPKEAFSSFLLPSKLDLLTQREVGGAVGPLPAPLPPGHAIVSLFQGVEEASGQAALKEGAMKDTSSMCYLISFPHLTSHINHPFYLPAEKSVCMSRSNS